MKKHASTWSFTAFRALGVSLLSLSVPTGAESRSQHMLDLGIACYWNGDEDYITRSNIDPRLVLKYSLPTRYEFLSIDIGLDANLFGWESDTTTYWLEVSTDSTGTYIVEHPDLHIEDKWGYRIRLFIGPSVRLRRLHFSGGVQAAYGYSQWRQRRIYTQPSGDTVWSSGAYDRSDRSLQPGLLCFVSVGMHWDRLSIDFCFDPYAAGLRATYTVVRSQSAKSASCGPAPGPGTSGRETDRKIEHEGTGD